MIRQLNGQQIRDEKLATCGANRLKNICNCAIGGSVVCWLLLGHPEGPEGCADKRN